MAQNHTFHDKDGLWKHELRKITYDDAKVQAQPYIDEMNNRGRAIAAKYGKKHQPFTFASLMR